MPSFEQQEGTTPLQLSEQYFRMTLDNSRIVVFLHDRELRYTWIHNPALGFRADDLLGRRDSELAFERPSDGILLESLKRQVIEQKRGLRQEVGLFSAGHERFYELSIEPLFDDNQAITGVACTAFDITERKDTELALQQANERLNLALSALNGFIYEYDLATGFTTRSAGMYKLLGYEIDEVPSTAVWWQAQIHPDDLGALNDEREQAEALSPRGREYRVRHKNGSYLYVWDHAIAIRNSAGQPVRWVGTTIDITARKLAEERQRFLSEAGKLLTTSLEVHQRAQDLVDLSVQRFAHLCVMFLRGPDGSIRRVASAHTDAEKANHLRSLLAQPPIQPQSNHPIAVALREERAILNPCIPESVVQATATSQLPAEVLRALIPYSQMIVPLSGRQGTIGALTFGLATVERVYTTDDLAIAQEVADRAALAIENAQLYRQAQEAIQLRDAFLSVASHELKTPLTALVGQAQLLQRRMDQNPASSERDLRAIRVIFEQGMRLNTLISTLFDVSQLELGQISMSRLRVDITNLIRRLVEEFQPMLQQHHLVLTLPEQRIVCIGDEMRLEQALRNLLQNALKYSPNGGQITVRLALGAHQIMISLSDQGIGIPKHALPNLFQRFYRAENGTKQHISGIGVGLYIVKEVVTLHGGDVFVESEEGMGSTFTIYLPYTPELA
jgi:PAS domain S-box-containing protein